MAVVLVDFILSYKSWVSLFVLLVTIVLVVGFVIFNSVLLMSCKWIDSPRLGKMQSKNKASVIYFTAVGNVG